MRKFTWVLSTLLLSAMISNVPTRAFQVAKVQINLPESSKDIIQTSLSKDNPPPTDPTTTGTRGPCTIAPLDLKTNTEVWSDRPMFVWRGPIGKIEVRQQGSNDVLWRETIPQGVGRIQYAGESLQPGETYNWVLFDLQNNAIRSMAFKVMDAREREQVSTQLQSLERELKAKGATVEESAARRAQYFAQRQLWSDAWREAFSVDNPVAIIGMITQTTPTPFCTRSPKPNSI
ncbi:MAG: hypothetical protein KME25_17540 [Symplocastrum torsivum CPER-KK1]|jgi:hypothetical protein|uniref:DUF928 domain-containing protein n=1 Tax=Symplocastrum torsivum CPER-KK1 TaxID=450513 RepID=A0A951UC15_9CYAN|nr:hypothetical protein [Symplocastrum torsivum CPER-KK1]